ncbi:MAG: 50S ribosome-binding GTPase [Candidatus Omnitrophica bacterium]|nr:50S ribosome-binding GTPase [Candidatus Omnitrophota bacterium]
MKIVIVGHVDHGKSTLIGRLLLDTDSLPEGKMAELKRISKELGRDAELAYLADQLKEEREREMTIDTTQTFFRTARRDYAIIDAPGHVEFIRNMLTGATQAEEAVLIVDVKAGLEEQTRRHAYLLGLLGIKEVIAVINKMDLAGYDRESFERVKSGLSGFLKGAGLSPSRTIPVSARNGDNISKRSSAMRWYKGASLLEALDSLKPKETAERKPMRFPVQDVYDISGEKIAVGKVLSGRIRQGQEVKVLPSMAPARIKAIKVFGKTLKSASSGANIGIVLDEGSLARRGEVIAEVPDLPQPKNRFKADLFWMSEEPLRLGKNFVFRCATQEAACVAERIERRMNSSTLEIIEDSSSELRLNEAAAVHFRTERPVVLEDFDFIEELGRFVIEAGKVPQGAGIITS